MNNTGPQITNGFIGVFLAAALVLLGGCKGSADRETCYSDADCDYLASVGLGRGGSCLPVAPGKTLADYCAEASCPGESQSNSNYAMPHICDVDRDNNNIADVFYLDGYVPIEWSSNNNAPCEPKDCPNDVLHITGLWAYGGGGSLSGPGACTDYPGLDPNVGGIMCVPKRLALPSCQTNFNACMTNNCAQHCGGFGTNESCSTCLCNKGCVNAYEQCNGTKAVDCGSGGTGTGGSGTGGGTGGSGTDGGGSTCQTNADCNDNNICTLDACPNGQCTHSTHSDCCNTNADCGPNQACKDHSCVASACQPECIGKACGDDGCGGSCGSCGDGFDCINNECVDNCVPPPCVPGKCGDNGCGELCPCQSGNGTPGGQEGALTYCNPKNTCATVKKNSWSDECDSFVSNECLNVQQNWAHAFCKFYCMTEVSLKANDWYGQFACLEVVDCKIKDKEYYLVYDDGSQALCRDLNSVKSQVPEKKNCEWAVCAFAKGSFPGNFECPTQQ